MFDSKDFDFESDAYRYFPEYITTDNADDLIEWFNQWRKDKPEETVQKGLFNLVERAIHKRAYNCVSSLLKIGGLIKIDKEALNKLLDKLIQKAADEGDGLMVLQLVNNNLAIAAHRLFSTKRDEAELKQFFQYLLRFMPFDTVDKLLEIYFIENNSAKELFSKIYQQAKQEFIEVAPYFSRYVKYCDIQTTMGVYERDSELDTCQADMQYGAKRLKLAKQFTDLVKDSKQITPKGDFSSLPPSSRNTQRAAVILEKVACMLFEDQKKEDFRKLRTTNSSWQTKIDGRYSSAAPLVAAVSLFSKSKDVKKDKSGYSLFYKVSNDSLEVNFVLGPLADQKLRSWHHGKAPLVKTWGRIEDVFEDILAMDLKNPSPEKLTDFYQLAAELVWLIGNTQPLNRGSGSFAEIMFAIIHLYHGRQPPILKTAFPQLDVLDITFPLSDYKFLFPYFFEPSTMPEHLRFKDIESSEPIEKQIEQLYKKLNDENVVKIERKL